MDRGPVWEEGEPASLPTAPILPPHLGGMDFLGRREPPFEGGGSVTARSLRHLEGGRGDTIDGDTERPAESHASIGAPVQGPQLQQIS